MTAVGIHRPTRTDWKRIREIRLRALRDAPHAFGSTFERESEFGDDDWISRLVKEDAAMFVAASEEEKYVGLVVGARYDDGAGLFSMWVAPEVRKHGIGRRLVEAVIEWATSRGYTSLLLDVGDENVSAITFYEKMGFKPTGVTGTLPPPREHIKEHQRRLKLPHSTGNIEVLPGKASKPLEPNA